MEDMVNQDIKFLQISSDDLNNHIIPYFDSSGNGKISKEEFRHKINDTAADPKVKDLLRKLRQIRHEIQLETGGICLQEATGELFGKFDNNSSGNITVSELKAGLLQMGIVYSNFEVRGKKFQFANVSLFLLRYDNPIRVRLVKLVLSNAFEWLVMLLIVSNSVILALEDFSDKGKYPDENGKTDLNLQNSINYYSDIVFTTLFAVESLLKILAFGFVLDEGSYLRDGWNCLDFSVVVFGILSLDKSGFGSLRVFRVVRPLRTISVMPSLRNIVESLIASIPAMLNVFFLMLMLSLFFSIFAVQLWNGRQTYHCHNTELPVGPEWDVAPGSRSCSPAGNGLYQCSANFSYCASDLDVDSTAYKPPKWLPEGQNWGITNFDNIGIAMISVFQCITAENWVTIMYIMQDCSDQLMVTIFFLVLVVSGGLFMINLMFAVMWEKYLSVTDSPEDAVKPRSDSTNNLDSPVTCGGGSYKKADTQKKPAAKKARNNLKRQLQIHPDPDVLEGEDNGEEFKEGPIVPALIPLTSDRPIVMLEHATSMQEAKTFRDKVDVMVTSENVSSFQYFMLFCIVLNTVVLAMDRYSENPSASYDREKNATEWINKILTVIFAVEMAINLYGMGCSRYWTSLLFAFDGVVVIATCLELLLSMFAKVEISGGALSALRFFRLCRLIKLVKGMKTLYKLLTQILQSLKQVANILFVLFLFLYIFSLMGMQFFAYQLRFDENGEHVKYNPHIPYQDTWTPLTNFDSFYESFLAVFQVVTGEDYNMIMYDAIRSKGYWSCLFFIACLMLGNIIVLNLFLAILLSNFDLANQAERTEELASRMRQKVKVKRRMGLLRNRAVAWAKATKSQREMKGIAQKAGSPIQSLVKRATSPGCLLGSGTSSLSSSWRSSTFLKKWASQENNVSAKTLKDFSKTGSSKKVLQKDLSVVEERSFECEEGDLSHPNGTHLGLGAQSLPTQSQLRRTVSEETLPSVSLKGAEPRQHHAQTLSLHDGTRSKDLQLSNTFPERLRGLCGIARTASEPNYPTYFAHALSCQTSSRQSFTLSEMEREVNHIISEPATSKDGSRAASDVDSEEAFARPLSSSSLAREGGGEKIPEGPPDETAQGNGLVLPSVIVKQPQGAAQTSSPVFEEKKGLTPRHSSEWPQTKPYKRCWQSLCDWMEGFATDTGVMSWVWYCCGCWLTGRWDKKGRGKVIPLPPKEKLARPPTYQSWLKKAHQEDARSIQQTLYMTRVENCCADDEIHHIETTAGNKLYLTEKKLQVLKGTPGGLNYDEDGKLELNDAQQILVTSWLMMNRSSSVISRASTRRLYAKPSVRRSLPRHIRNLAQQVVRRDEVEYLILGLIVFSSIILVLGSPLDDPQSVKSKFLIQTDVVITIVFSAEMLLKVFAMSPRGYFHGKDMGWNIMDFLIVAIGLFSTFMPQQSQLSSIRALRAMRAIRPLRLIQRNPGLKQVVNTMVIAIPSLSNVVIVLFFFFLIFGILGTTYFKGSFYECDFSPLSQAEVEVIAKEYGFTRQTYVQDFTKENCLNLNLDWVKTIDQNFNNVIQSMMTLFEMSTLENWVNIMHAGINAKGIEIQPVEGYQRWWSLYFIFFIIVGNFFAMNLFVGAVIENYQKQKREESTGLMTENQRQWIEAQRLMSHADLKVLSRKPKNRFRAVIYRIVHPQEFDNFILFLIILNAVVMMLKHAGEPHLITSLIDYANISFTCIFLTELIFKLIAFGPRWPMRNGWNMFDTIVVLFASVTWAISFEGEGTATRRLSVVAVTARVARVLLLFRVIRRAKTMRQLADVVIQELPSIVNVSGLLFLVLFIYTVVGINLFAQVQLQENLNMHANFQTFWRAFLTLFRCATGEGWNNILYELMLRPDGTEDYLPHGSSCKPYPTYNEMSAAWEQTQDRSYMIGCGTPGYLTYPFFITFMLLTSLVMINLFVAIIVDSVGESSRRNENSLTPQQFKQFCDIWSEFDTEAKYRMSIPDLFRFIERVPAPLGLGGLHPKESQVRRFIYELQLDKYSDYVSFYNVCTNMGERLILEHAIISRADEEVAFLKESRREHEVKDYRLSETNKKKKKKSNEEDEAKLTQDELLIKHQKKLWQNKRVRTIHRSFPNRDNENTSQYLASRVIQRIVRHFLFKRRNTPREDQSKDESRNQKLIGQTASFTARSQLRAEDSFSSLDHSSDSRFETSLKSDGAETDRKSDDFVEPDSPKRGEQNHALTVQSHRQIDAPGKQHINRSNTGTSAEPCQGT